MKRTDARKTFLDVPSEDVIRFLAEHGAPAFHAREIYRWFFTRGVEGFEQMTNLPHALRGALSARYCLHPLTPRGRETSAEDGTIRYLWAARDGCDIPTVYLPEKDHFSLCLSVQVGCAHRCAFCASGLVPFRRQLSAAEIVDQVLRIENDQKATVSNLLFMGMGEPLANYTQVTRAIRWFTSPEGKAMSPGRITLSTSGLAPQIVKMTDDGLRVGLALSLHAVRDDLRKKIMPVASRWGVREVIKAARNYHRKTQAPVTVEYVLLGGVNDHWADAVRLCYLVKGFARQVNLIPYNPVHGLHFERPSDDSVHRFQGWLRERGVPVFVRKPKGLDIGSACGQLGPAVSA